MKVGDPFIPEWSDPKSEYDYWWDYKKQILGRKKRQRYGDTILYLPKKGMSPMNTKYLENNRTLTFMFLAYNTMNWAQKWGWEVYSGNTIYSPLNCGNCGFYQLNYDKIKAWEATFGTDPIPYTAENIHNLINVGALDMYSPWSYQMGCPVPTPYMHASGKGTFRMRWTIPWMFQGNYTKVFITPNIRKPKLGTRAWKMGYSKSTKYDEWYGMGIPAGSYKMDLYTWSDYGDISLPYTITFNPAVTDIHFY